MRQPEEKGRYAVDHEDGHPRVVHAVKARAPKNGVEITEDQAREICASLRARDAQSLPAARGAGGHASIDLSPILSRLDAVEAKTAAVEAKTAEVTASVLDFTNKLKGHL